MKILLICLTIVLLASSMGCSNPATKNENSIKELEKIGISCKEILYQKDELVGQTITISAYNWGVTDLLGGGCSLRLGDEESEGVQPSSVVVDFYSNADEEIKKIAKGTLLNISAQVTPYEYGAVHLTNPTILK